jgi:hypothetical protein
MANDKNYITQRLEMEEKSCPHSIPQRNRDHGSKAIMEIPMVKLQKSGSHTFDNVAPSGKINVSASAAAGTGRLWRVATIKQHGIGQLFGIPVCDNETGEEIMRKIHIRFGRRKSKQAILKQKFPVAL